MEVQMRRSLLFLSLALMACHADPAGHHDSWGEGCEAYLGYVEDQADVTGLDVSLLVGVMRAESNFNPEAVSSVGARGLMQVMPGTGDHFDCGDLFDPAENIACGARVLSNYIGRVGGDVDYGLAAYNSGLGPALKAKKAGRTPRNIGYVRKVRAFQKRFHQGGCARL
jgi:soluble lytic murein transglycosylase-like protein